MPWRTTVLKKAILQRTDVEGINAENNGTLEGQTLVPGMSLYEFSQVSDAESQAVGDEEPIIFDS